MEPKLKPPGTERLTLKCDEPPSKHAFKSNLRRYIMEHVEVGRFRLNRRNPS